MVFSVMKRVILKISLISAPKMSFKSDAAKLDFERVERENDHEACFPVIRFARDWARLMEKQIVRGEELDGETIRKCEHLAAIDVNNDEESSPVWAKRLLVDDWKYGKYLKNYE